MKIKKALFVPGKSAFFFDDQTAIKRGAEHDGFTYRAEAVTPGFRRVREAGECVSVLLLLDDGSVAVGDCAAVQYSGAGGRDGLFLAENYLGLLEKRVRPQLEGLELSSFRSNARIFEELEVDGKRLHTAIRYGVSQALLDAQARAERKPACLVICAEYGLPTALAPVPIFGQSGDNRYENADKMILKRVDALPHALINNVDEKLGRDGGKLKEYIRWLVARIAALGGEGYRPAIHIDVYGTIGLIFGNAPGKVAEYLAGLTADAGGLPLYIEGPVDVGAKQAQIDALAEICRLLKRAGSPLKVVADEWCNTLEDVRDFADAQACHMAQIKTPDLGGIQNSVESVLYCKAHGVEAYLGGTCNETDVSARACVHAALAARADRMLAKPGMGFDEGFCVVHNEMRRALALVACQNDEREKLAQTFRRA